MNLRSILLFSCLSFLPLPASAAFSDEVPISELAIPFIGRLTPLHSSSSVSSASSSSSSSRTKRAALRQLSRYEQQFSQSSINRTLRDVVKLTNDERRTHDLPALKEDPALSAFAQAYAKDMSVQGYFSHDMPEGISLMDRLKNSIVYRRVGACRPCNVLIVIGENIAVGQKTASEVVQDWIDSPEHHANMLRTDVDTIGVGRQGKYWSQEFFSSAAQ